MTEQETKAVAAYETARKEVLKQLNTNQGGKKAEVGYAIAYQSLVVLGLAPQLKRKYRL